MRNREAFIGLGSNLGNPIKQLSNAIVGLSRMRHTELTNVSGFYRNPPVGEIVQPHYVNAVVRVETGLRPEELFAAMEVIESDLGRPSDRKRWSARIIDLDLLIYGKDIINTEKLKVPHPQISNRSFVLLPLFEIAPGLEVPGFGRVKDMLKGKDISNLIDMKLVWKNI